ncbi:MAG TPA: phosphotransferase [Anaerolineales bacterium]|nr:phosphotransferase [Anaerolineales bacterium]
MDRIGKLHNRTRHQQAVCAFLDQEFSPQEWTFSLPHGWGNETYFAHGNGQTYFVKLGAILANYETMASLGLTPPVLRAGKLEDGTPIIVQPYVEGRTPSWADFHAYLPRIAEMIHSMHHSLKLKRVLPGAPFDDYRQLALAAHQRLLHKWQIFKTAVPDVTDWVDESLDKLYWQMDSLTGAGKVASHNDICNANWLITPKGKVYLLDLDGMSLDDPAHDLGALLWWYYPPDLRERFLKIAGYEVNELMKRRMRLRMAVHCLDILLPRDHSFDQFDRTGFSASLADYQAIIAGEENPRGYE